MSGIGFAKQPTDTGTPYGCPGQYVGRMGPDVVEDHPGAIADAEDLAFGVPLDGAEVGQREVRSERQYIIQ